MTDLANGDSGPGAVGCNGLPLELFNPNGVCYWESDERHGIGDWNDGANFPDDCVTARHGGGGTLASFDGHAEWMRQTEWTNETTFKPGRLWCNPLTTNGYAWN